MAATTNLYPPIIDTYQKAFLVNSESASQNICRIYFALSMFNSTSDIKNVQIAVRNQNTNLSVLDTAKYPSEIKIANLNIDNSITTDAKYYVELLPTDIQGGNFTIDQYYKVQLRFTSIDATNPPITSTSQPIDTWLADNLLYFSEWSTVTLVRGISVPIVALQDFTSGAVTEIYSTIANTHILGKLIFADNNETETLKSYRIKFFNQLDEELLDSGEIYTNNFNDINQIDYTINYILEPDNMYTFTLDITTQNLYQMKTIYYIDAIQAETDPLNVTITAEIDEENARTKIDLDRASSYGTYTGQLVIRRTDNKSNFTIWNDMYFYLLDGVSSIDLTWYDYTIESGILYKYAVQGINTVGARTPMTIISAPIMTIFDHSFLTIGDKQLKLEFNPQISSFKHTLSETRIETMGSKYPFIKRNGILDYVQFPIGGLIASAMDEDGLFVTKEQIYGTNKTYYDNFNNVQEIPEYRDMIYERFFREKVMNFLYADDVKLFRSPTEGNFIIRLMDTQFQPNQTLGRRLWSFTTNAYEIDECNLTNLQKYKLLISSESVANIAGSTLTPIRKIVIINNENEFPDQGRSDVLYIYNRELYIWDADNNIYLIISVPYWNHEPGTPTISENNNLYLNNLYTDGESLFQWNSNADILTTLSEPLYNNEYLGDAE